MVILLVIIAIFIVLSFCSIYIMIKHAKQVPDDCYMEEYEIKLKNEIENENFRKTK